VQVPGGYIDSRCSLPTIATITEEDVKKALYEEAARNAIWKRKHVENMKINSIRTDYGYMVGTLGKERNICENFQNLFSTSLKHLSNSATKRKRLNRTHRVSSLVSLKLPKAFPIISLSTHRFKTPRWTQLTTITHPRKYGIFQFHPASCSRSKRYGERFRVPIDSW